MPINSNLQNYQYAIKVLQHSLDIQLVTAKKEQTVR